MSGEKAYLALEDGLVLEGVSCGAPGEASGELVFNTSMTGYQEILTDPSYRGQVVLMTYPLIGNYGVLDDDSESGGIQAEGLVVRETAAVYSNPRARLSLAAWLRRQGKPAVGGLDTRRLTVHLREKGSLKVFVSTLDDDCARLTARARAAEGVVGRAMAEEAGTDAPYWWNSDGRRKAVVLDCGVKRSILARLAARGWKVLVVPPLTPPEEIISERPDCLVLSNGPGDPAALPAIAAGIARLVGRLPIRGICLGHQLLGLACGGRTVKLKFGHHGANHPVRDEQSGRVLITAQNHGFCLADEGLPGEAAVSHRNLNDGTVEGLASRKLHFASVQFHPEAGPGPNDALGFFDIE